MLPTGWKNQGTFLITASGEKISIHILNGFTYWNYLQQCCGYGQAYPPVLPKNSPADHLTFLEGQLEYLIALHEARRRRDGIGFQQPITF